MQSFSFRLGIYRSAVAGNRARYASGRLSHAIRLNCRPRAVSPFACSDICRYRVPCAGSTLLLDLGCGTGRSTVPFAEHLGVSVIGVDPSQTMLQKAAHQTRSRRITYREGRAEAIPLGANVAGLIFMSNAIHHVTNLDKSLQEMSRVHQPQGIVFIRNYSLENLSSLGRPSPACTTA